MCRKREYVELYVGDTEQGTNVEQNIYNPRFLIFKILSFLQCTPLPSSLFIYWISRRHVCGLIFSAFENPFHSFGSAKDNANENVSDIS